MLRLISILGHLFQIKTYLGEIQVHETHPSRIFRWPGSCQKYFGNY